MSRRQTSDEKPLQLKAPQLPRGKKPTPGRVCIVHYPHIKSDFKRIRGWSSAGVATLALAWIMGGVSGAPQEYEEMLIICPTTKDLNHMKDSFAIFPPDDNKNFVLACDWLVKDPHNPDCISHDNFSLVTLKPDRVVAKGPWDMVHRHGSFNLQLLPADEDLARTPCLINPLNDVLSCDWLLKDPHTPVCISLVDLSLVTCEPDRVVAKGPWHVVHRHGSFNLQLLPPDENLPSTPCLINLPGSTKTPLTTTLTPEVSEDQPPCKTVYIVTGVVASLYLALIILLFLRFRSKQHKGRPAFRGDEKHLEVPLCCLPEQSGDGVGRGTGTDMQEAGVGKRKEWRPWESAPQLMVNGESGLSEIKNGDHIVLHQQRF